MTDRWTIAGYADFEDHSDASFEYVQFRTVVSRYRLFEAGERLFDTALYFEYYMPNTAYGRSEKLETRLIFEKTFAPVNVRINPIFEKAFSTSDVEEGVEHSSLAEAEAYVDNIERDIQELQERTSPTTTTTTPGSTTTAGPTTTTAN